MKTTELILKGVRKLRENIYDSKGYKVAQNIDFEEYELTEECIQHLRDLQDETLNNVLDTYNELKQKAFDMAYELILDLQEVHKVINAIKFIKDNED